MESRLKEEQTCLYIIQMYWFMKSLTMMASLWRFTMWISSPETVKEAVHG